MEGTCQVPTLAHQPPRLFLFSTFPSHTRIIYTYDSNHQPRRALASLTYTLTARPASRRTTDLRAPGMCTKRSIEAWLQGRQDWLVEEMSSPKKARTASTSGVSSTFLSVNQTDIKLTSDRPQPDRERRLTHRRICGSFS